MNDPEELGEQSPQSFLLMSLILEMGLGGLAVLLGLFFGPDPRQLVPSGGDWDGILWGLGLGILASLPLLGVIQILEHLPLEPIRKLRRSTEEKILHLMVDLRTVDLLGISICAGVGEELLFRGWLLMSFAGPAPQWTATALILPVLASSVAFGLAHPISPTYIVVTGLIGVYMALLLIWSGNLLVPIAAHGCYDFLQLILATRELRKSQRSRA